MFKMKIVSFHKKALERQVTEAVKIREAEAGTSMNSKSEWGAAPIPRIAIQKGEKIIDEEEEQRRRKKRRKLWIRTEEEIEREKENPQVEKRRREEDEEDEEVGSHPPTQKTRNEEDWEEEEWRELFQQLER